MHFQVILVRESVSPRQRGIAGDMPNDPTTAARRS